jgi:hypothetical protein
MAGPPKHWQGLTEAQLAACDAIARERVQDIFAAFSSNATCDAADVWLRMLLQTRCEGAACAWLGGLGSGVLWHRSGPDYQAGNGHLWMGQMVIQVVGVPKHVMHLDVGEPQPAFAYLLVSGEDHPNYLIQGWAKGYDCTPGKLIKRDGREFQDARVLRGLGQASIVNHQHVLAVRGKK